jgi:carbamate kinase
VERGNLVITAGGGGVPVVRDDGLRGIEAVVDKDKTSQLLGSKLGADTLVVLTDVEFAYVNYETPDQRPLRRLSAGELRAHLEAGEFGEGSMQPKVEACLRFVEQGGERAVITSPEHLTDALTGEAGTQISA